MSTTARSTATSSACARNSRRSIRNSRKSKPSMASAIDTATAEATARPAAAPQAPPAGPAGGRSAAPDASADALPDAPWAEPADESRAAGDRPPLRPAWRFRRPRLSPLTRRIVAVNVLPLALLAIGFLYLGKFEASLIGQQIESLHMQGQIFAAALSEGAVLDSADEGEILLPELSRQMMR